mmetsp:Transcript_39968/g.119003  ORF Transcript_39968/g.119003 Transcript_39968/m.119003 type:complete len:88 (+) Transcript_39968:763-1026(+)|eukprot:365618-Chlamydomonas_euryale.AAC.4
MERWHGVDPGTPYYLTLHSQDAAPAAAAQLLASQLAAHRIASPDPWTLCGASFLATSLIVEDTEVWALSNALCTASALQSRQCTCLL